MIYFDNSATTPIEKSVLETYVRTSQRIIGNPSSLHNKGTQAQHLLSLSREQIALNLGVKPGEIFFTSGGTEGNNWVIKGTALEKHPFGKHIIISDIEHASVGATAAQLEQLGFEISYAPVDSKGFVDVLALEKLITSETILVSVMVVNNEMGAIQPINEIAEMLTNYPTIHFHVDGVQALGKVPVKRWLHERVDFATFSGHKFHGPKGTGFLFWRSGRKIAPLITGGGQESKQRSGTENVPGYVAMSRAVRLQLEDETEKIAHQTHIRDYLIDSLSQYEKVTLFTTAEKNFSPHIICFGIAGIKGEVLVHAFEAKDMFISTTSACSSKTHVVGSTLHAMKVPNKVATTAVRLSLSVNSTLAEAEQFMIAFHQLYQQFSKIN